MFPNSLQRTIVFLLNHVWTSFVVVGPILVFLLSLDSYQRASISGKTTSQQQLENDDVWSIIQVSDLHIGQDEKQIDHFKEFLKRLSIHKPKFVFCTGDVTDGRTYQFPGISGQQHEGEWKLYYNALVSADVAKKDFWFDVPGNHDYYGTESIKDEKFYANDYTVQKLDEKEFVREIIHEENGKKYRFLLINANSHPYAPVSFEGHIDAENREKLEELLKNSNQYVHTFIVNHYPLNLIISTSVGRTMPSRMKSTLRSHLSGSLSGHLHTEGILRHDDYLEMTVQDMKSHKAYRIITFDNGIFNLHDVTLDGNEFPIVTITLPKQADIMTEFDPLDLMRKDPQIRAFVHTNSEIKKVEGFIDDEPICELSLSHDDFYSCRITDSSFLKGMHQIKVVAEDKIGNKGIHSYSFSIEGDTGTGNTAVFSRISITELCATWHFFGIFFVLLWLLIFPQLYLFGMKKWASFKTENKFIIALDKIFGSIAVSWVNAINTGHATFDDYLKGINSKPITKFFSFFFWELVRVQTQFGQIPIFYVLAYVGVVLASIVVPLQFGENWIAVFSFGAVSSKVYPYFLSHLLHAICVTVFITVNLCALCDLFNEYKQPRESGPKLPSTYSIILFIISAIGFLIYIIAIFVIFPIYSFFLSSFTWIYIFIWLITFYALSQIRESIKVSSSLKESDVELETIASSESDMKASIEIKQKSNEIESVRFEKEE